MGASKVSVALALILGSLFLGSAAQAQILYGKPPSGNVRPTLTHWNLERAGQKTSFDQFYLPFYGFVPLRENLEARIFLSRVDNQLEQAGDDFSLEGFSDLRLQVSQSYAEDHLLLSLGFNLPTGKKRLTFDNDLALMNILTQSYLAFPIRRLGEGFGLNALGAFAFLTGSFRLGVSAAFQYNGAYEAYLDNGDYDPGDLLKASLFLDKRTPDLNWKGSITFATSSNDRLDDQDVFSQGNQLEFHTGLVHGRERLDLRMDVRYLIRGKNTAFSLGEVVVDQLQLYGNEFVAFSSVLIGLEGGWRIGPLIGFRLIEANEFLLDRSEIWDIGGQVLRPISPAVDLGVVFRYFTGQADGGAIDLTGYSVSTFLKGAL